MSNLNLTGLKLQYDKDINQLFIEYTEPLGTDLFTGFSFVTNTQEYIQELFKKRREETQHKLTLEELNSCNSQCFTPFLEGIETANKYYTEHVLLFDKLKDRLQNVCKFRYLENTMLELPDNLFKFRTFLEIEPSNILHDKGFNYQCEVISKTLKYVLDITLENVIDGNFFKHQYSIRDLIDLLREVEYTIINTQKVTIELLNTLNFKVFLDFNNRSQRDLFYEKPQ